MLEYNPNYIAWLCHICESVHPFGSLICGKGISRHKAVINAVLELIKIMDKDGKIEDKGVLWT